MRSCISCISCIILWVYLIIASYIIYQRYDLLGGNSCTVSDFFVPFFYLFSVFSIKIYYLHLLLTIANPTLNLVTDNIFNADYSGAFYLLYSKVTLFAGLTRFINYSVWWADNFLGYPVYSGNKWRMRRPSHGKLVRCSACTLHNVTPSVFLHQSTESNGSILIWLHGAW